MISSTDASGYLLWLRSKVVTGPWTVERTRSKCDIDEGQSCVLDVPLIHRAPKRRMNRFLIASKWKYFRTNGWVKVRWDWSATGTLAHLASSCLVSPRVRFPKHANLSVGSHHNLPTTGHKKSDPSKTRHRAQCKTAGFRCSFHILARSDRRREGIALQVRCSSFNRTDRWRSAQIFRSFIRYFMKF